MSPRKSEDILEAAAINAGACDFCSAVHVNLVDDAGEVFATAAVPIEHVDPLIEKLRVAKAEVVARPHHAPARRQ